MRQKNTASRKMIGGPEILFLHIVSSLQTFKKSSQRKRGVERLGKTGVSLSVVERSSLNSGASNAGAKLCRKIAKVNRLVMDDGRILAHRASRAISLRFHGDQAVERGDDATALAIGVDLSRPDAEMLRDLFSSFNDVDHDAIETQLRPGHVQLHRAYLETNHRARRPFAETGGHIFLRHNRRNRS